MLVNYIDVTIKCRTLCVCVTSVCLRFQARLNCTRTKKGERLSREQKIQEGGIWISITNYLKTRYSYGYTYDFEIKQSNGTARSNSSQKFHDGGHQTGDTLNPRITRGLKNREEKKRRCKHNPNPPVFFQRHCFPRGFLWKASVHLLNIHSHIFWCKNLEKV